jgi:LysR family glycine cleavage system transcriptional activator
MIVTPKRRGFCGAKRTAPRISTFVKGRFSSSDLVLRAAAHGLGVALARHRLVAEDVHTGVLVRPFGPHAVALDNAYWTITAPQHPLRPATRLVIAWLRREAVHQCGID